MPLSLYTAQVKGNASVLVYSTAEGKCNYPCTQHRLRGMPVSMYGCSEVHLKKLLKNSFHQRTAKLILADIDFYRRQTENSRTLPIRGLKYNKVVMMFKVSDGGAPHYIHSLFSRSTGRYASNNSIPPRPRTNLYKTSLAFSGSST